MRRAVVRCLIPMIVVAIASGCATQQAKPVVDQAAVIAKIDSLNTNFNGAVAAKDTIALTSMYADDAHVLPANGPRADGKEAIHQLWAGFLATPGLDLKATSTTKIVSEAGDQVVDIGTYQMTMAGPKGMPMHDVGKYLTVHQKTNGEWKIVADTWNSDMPMPGTTTKK